MSISFEVRERNILSPLFRADFNVPVSLVDFRSGIFSLQGTIAACPVASEFGAFHLGTIFDTDPESTRDALFVEQPCTSCDVFSLCGGRCLYANLTKPWGEKDFTLVCRTVKNLIFRIKAAEEKVRGLIKDGKISIDQFEFYKYNGCEIIP